MTKEYEHIPPAVRRQLEAAERLQQQVYGTPAGDTPPEPAVPAPAVVSAPQPAPEPVPQPAPVPAPQPDVPPVPNPEEDTFRARYMALQGKYNAEVPLLHEQLRTLNVQLQGVMQELAQAKQRDLPQPPAPEPDNDAAVFGEDLIQAMDRRSRKVFEALVAERTKALTDELASVKAQLGQVNQQVVVTAEDRFYADLEKACSQYEAVNVDPRFIAWLDQIDPMFGVKRNVALQAALHDFDGTRAGAIFKAFVDSVAPAAPAPQPQPQPQSNQNRQELERQVAPSATQAGSSEPTQGKVITGAQYAYAYDPRTIHKVGAEEVARLQREADQALAEGRVRW